MIVGCDHLGIGVSDIEAGIEAGVVQLGYRCKFRESNLPNHPSKRPYIASWEDNHDIAFLRPTGGGPSLELIHHSDDSAAGHARRIALVITGPLSPQQWPDAPCMWTDELTGPVSEAFGSARAQAISLPGDLGPALVIDPIDAAVSSGRVLGVVIRVPNLRQSVAYWKEALGFQVTATSENGQPSRWVTLGLTTPVPSWALQVTLVESPDIDRSPDFLDDLGVTNVCLLSTDVETDARFLGEYPGAEMEAPFRISVSGRQLRIAIGHGPGGENIELIEIERSARSRNA